MSTRKSIPGTVAVLGGGVGGLSAAHELAERGFRVTVYEASRITGGKARSIFVPGSGTGGRRDLPGEHGFRFFPSFYRHLPDTMRRIPFGRNPDGVAGNLVATSRTRLARIDGQVVKFANPMDAIRHGLALCPEERKTDGIVAELSVRENIALALQARMGVGQFLSRAEQTALAQIQPLVTEHRFEWAGQRHDFSVLRLALADGSGQRRWIGSLWAVATPAWGFTSLFSG